MDKTFKLICSRIALTASIIVALLLVGSACSRFITPNRSVIAAYWGLAFPIFLALNLLVLLFWAILRKRFFFVQLAAILLSSGSIWRYAPLNVLPPRVVENCDTLSVLTYNTLFMERLKSQMKSDPNRILSYIRESDADIVCLQEFSYAKKGKQLELRTINKVLPGYPYHKIFKINNAKNNALGMAVYSKYPIKEVQNIRYNEAYNASCIYEIDVNGRTITVVNNHLESNKLTEKDKDTFKEMVTKPGRERVTKTKYAIAPKMGHAFKERAKQADQIAARLAQIETPVIVCGDFNDTPQSYSYYRIRGKLNDAVTERGFGPTITYNSRGLWFRIDHILHSSHFRTIKVERGDTKASDHYPLQATFTW